MMQIKLVNGFVITNPEERIRDYCAVEVYRGYDDCHGVTNTISWRDIRAANGLYARIGSSVAQNMMQSTVVSAALRTVANTELGYVSDEDWNILKGRAQELFESTCFIKGVGIAVATKVLHLKRPEMIPIVDSFVAKFLLGIELQNINDKSSLVQVGAECMNIIRHDIRRNYTAFELLQERLSNLPIRLTNVRLYDILVWSTEKWDVRGDLGAPYGTPRTAAKTLVPAIPPARASIAESRIVLKSGIGSCWREIETLSDFNGVINKRQGYICITDSANGNKVHRPICSGLTEKNFKTKVIKNGGKNGRYYWVESIELAKKRWNAFECCRCLLCRRH